MMNETHGLNNNIAWKTNIVSSVAAESCTPSVHAFLSLSLSLSLLLHFRSVLYRERETWVEKCGTKCDEIERKREKKKRKRKEKRSST